MRFRLANTLTLVFLSIDRSIERTHATTQSHL
jgi:hypothetical protein